MIGEREEEGKDRKERGGVGREVEAEGGYLYPANISHCILMVCLSKLEILAIWIN